MFFFVSLIVISNWFLMMIELIDCIKLGILMFNVGYFCRRYFLIFLFWLLLNSFCLILLIVILFLMVWCIFGDLCLLKCLISVFVVVIEFLFR